MEQTFIIKMVSLKRVMAIWFCSCFVALLYIYKLHLYDYIMTPLNDSNVHNDKYIKETQAAFEDLDLYLRTSSAFLDKYDNLLLPSLRYFWPGNVSIVVVLDEENAKDKELGKILPGRYPYPRVEYQSPIHPSIYHGRGHERMQRDFFYPEEKIKKQYVGYIDTDSVFVTRVTPELLFEKGKPIVIGNYGKEDIKWWNDVALCTESMFRSKEVMKGMSYFPVIMKVSHIVELRRYMEKLHNKTFDEIYKMFSGGPFSQFNVMCQYIWMFHRDEYKFYFHLRSYNNGTWNGEGNSPGRQPYEFYQTNVSDEHKVPKPRAAIHYRYHDNWKNPSTLRNVYKAGICFSGGFDLCPDICKHLNRTALQRELYYFEFNDWSWDKRCLDEQRKHYKLVASETNDEAVKSLKAGCAEVESLSFKP